MRRAVGQDAPVEVLIGDEAILLRPRELDRVVEALTAAASRDAAEVAEEITAQRLAGGTIRLLPTESQERALRLALAGRVRGGPLGAALLRLVGFG